MHRRRFLQSGAAALPVALAGCVLGAGEATETVSERYAVDDGTRVSVVGRNGPIDVTRADGDEVVMEATKHSRGGQDLLDEVEITADESGDALEIRAEYPDESPIFGPRVAVDFALRLPEGAIADRFETSNGEVTVAGVAGDARLISSNGRVTAEDVDGFVSLRTSNGGIDATGVAGLDRALTSNGEVDVDLPALRESVDVESSNGSVTVRAAADLEATVDLETSNGDVSVEGLSLETETVDDDRIVGHLNGGGPRVSVETTNGDVTLRALS